MRELVISEDERMAAAVAAAARADAAIVVVGTTPRTESEGFDRDTLTLPGRQDELVRAVASANPRTVVVVNSGSPIEMPWRSEVAAVLLT
jgi:beta-glucosidase